MVRRIIKTKVQKNQLDMLTILEEGIGNDIVVPNVIEKQPGTFDFDQRIRSSLNNVIKNSVFSRAQIADQLTSLVGRDVSESTLNTYTGKGRPNRLPADLLPALTMVLGPEFLAEIASWAGCQIAERHEMTMARIGQLFLITNAAKKEQEQLIKETPLFSGQSNV